MTGVAITGNATESVSHSQQPRNKRGSGSQHGMLIRCSGGKVVSTIDGAKMNLLLGFIVGISHDFSNQRSTLFSFRPLEESEEIRALEELLFSLMTGRMNDE